MNGPFRLILLTLIMSFASLGFTQKSSWLDPVSERAYLLLDKKVNWAEASKQCRAQGLTMLDLRFLSDDERAQFLKADALKFSDWESRYSSTPPCSRH